MTNARYDRLLEIFFRFLRGEQISVCNLAQDYRVSTKTISRTIADLKAFLADHRELMGQAELHYSNRDKRYSLSMENFLNQRELFAMMKVLIGARALPNEDLELITTKLQKFTSYEDREIVKSLIANELSRYKPVKHAYADVLDSLWTLATCISAGKEVTLDYYRSDLTWSKHQVVPASLMFSEHYFYLIAFKVGSRHETPIYFRVDRIKELKIHRKTKSTNKRYTFDEGALRQKSLFMWPGEAQTIRFEFTGPSLQAVLDKLPTAKVVSPNGQRPHIIEADVYGDGIMMWLLSQGPWVKVIAPDAFVDRMREQIRAMGERYG